MQGEFQRTFLIMRPLDAEEAAGFCRVERKQNRGRLAFNIQGISREGDLHAVLVKQDGGEWKVTDCGQFRLDPRGNGTVTRDIDGISVASSQSYKAVGVARVTPEGVQLAMLGFFGKGKPLDRESIEEATARALGLGSAPSAPRQMLVTPPLTPPIATPPVAVETAPAAEPVIAQEPQIDQESGSDAPQSGLPENAWSPPAQEPGEFVAVGLPEELEGIIWPESVLPLRELFERFDVVSPVTGSEAEVFVRIPMEDGIVGVDHYLLGVRLAKGTIAAIGYAVPGFADACPAGLDDYVFYETPIGGYWIRWEDVA